jgi:5-(carboxyamino)imidazole ribonucleotide synthase
MSPVEARSIGLIGGGQLGRMLAMAARRLGLWVEVLDPDPKAPAAALADRHHLARFDDSAAALAFAERVSLVTFEFENVPASSLAQLERIRPVRPSPRVLAICRQRIDEKAFLADQGFPVAPYRAIRSQQDLARALTELSGPLILKTAEFGYDGKGQVRLSSADQGPAAYASIGSGLAVLEQVVPFERELSVIVARSVNGEVAAYPPFENQHRNQVLDLTYWPARVPPAVAQAAERLAVEVAQRLDVIGLLCVELFQIGERLLINELAPRPHNSGHLTIEAAETDQFEQHLRAILGWPLGSTAARSPAAMANLLGDLWQPSSPDMPGCLADKGVHLHLYGKAEARPGRKMGHITVLDRDPAAASARATAARQRFGRR